MGQGHEARVVMMLNDEVVATMYDKDYSGNNNRYAMFGQSVILDMKGLYVVDITEMIMIVQVGERFKVVLDKGSLGVSGGQNHFISFLGHLISPNTP